MILCREHKQLLISASTQDVDSRHKEHFFDWFKNRVKSWDVLVFWLIIKSIS